MSGPEILSSVREELLAEARQSPGLLADLANLERYVAETYSARSFIELLQNADDAQAQKFVMVRSGEWLICANDGRAFSRQDFYSLCRSASSAKQRGQTIGYRGIGFKSIVGVASSVHLFSDDLQTSFSRDLTRLSLGSDTPTPLVRVPHPLALQAADAVFSEVKALQASGLTTVFVLGGLDSDRINDEFEQFVADYLLFLRHVREAVLTGANNRRYTCSRQKTGPGILEVAIAGPERHSAWRIHHVGECDLAFSLDNGEPTALVGNTAIAHAFLPTLEPTGFGIRVNADFSTDPSRTRIVFDDATFQRLDEAADAIASLITQATLSGEIGLKIRRALVPTTELATISLQKRSFRTELIARVKAKLTTLKDQVLLAPTWLNTLDVGKLSSQLKFNVLIQGVGTDTAQTTFQRYIGIQVISPRVVAECAKKMTFSPIGGAELIACVTRDAGAGLTMRELIDIPIWWAVLGQEPTKLLEIVKTKAPFSTDFSSALIKTGLLPRQLASLLLSAGLAPNEIATLLPDLPGPISIKPLTTTLQLANSNRGDSAQPSLDIFLSSTPDMTSPRFTKTAPITSQSLPAWRGAEQYVALVLGENGYAVEDRSRQNLGYDLYAEKGAIKAYLEVKLLDYAGQPFIITTNEEVVARECGDKYVIALTVRSAGQIYIQFVRDPVRNLKFVRQCRQWVWECSDYVFTPTQTHS